MTKMVFKPWEQGLTNIKLVPKLVLLMVFSTVLLVCKQLWDANTFYHSVVEIQQDRAKEQAEATAAGIRSILSDNTRDSLLVEQLVTAQAKAMNAGAYVYLVERDAKKVLGHPQARRLTDLTAQVENGTSLSQQLQQHRGAASLILADQSRFEYAVELPALNWVVVASQPASEAETYYQQYLMQVAWQTGLMIVSFMVILLGGSSVMLRQTRYLADNIQRLAARDMSQPIQMECRDEYGDLARELEKTRRQLREVICNQREAASELSELAEVMSVSMMETKASAQEEFNEIDQLASAMSEMSSTVQTVAEHAREASAATEGSSAQAEQGQQFVSQTINIINLLSQDITQSAHAVNQVEERVEQIGSVIVTIQGISEQTNLLALNAAIEAARAGEAGRGFAVVADEVRNLAQRTQTATIEIQEMISQLQGSAQQAVQLMEQSVVEAAEGVEQVTSAGGELDKIVEQVRLINDMNFQIASAAEQQSAVADEMNQNLTNVRELVQASVNVVTELTETADVMQNHATDLEKKIQAFTV
ncbi:methyl-accepting chemotaxis protein [Photobacterium ganghwense]|uniref:Chemotaxis protein n=1 Tax=Photobacterium ganghwense TaxID=320778 RepID=A0A0J1HHZ5_9GAMM|nr:MULTISPECIES: methyl-accepting chemotaxis protein [Photobacterium]KLV11225.1 chemotaxis protein [Photobacterium ganghwense]PSU05149.1 methyl-accepting chemotaxis protein [Photobacterium ganghwense]QSV13760.1 methyl-accepting chemotaxis protein [Photobacterium ganghwense]